VTERQSKETKDAEHLILLTFPQHFFSWFQMTRFRTWINNKRI